jgi:uncharacterized protein DUF3761
MRKAGWWAAALIALVAIYNSQTHQTVPPVAQHPSSQAPLQQDPPVAADPYSAGDRIDEPSAVQASPNELQDHGADQQDQYQSGDQHPDQDPELSNDRHYLNSDGEIVHSPAYSNTVPAGATAQCADGTYSFSQHRQGTCSHHGGVASWL